MASPVTETRDRVPPPVSRWVRQRLAPVSLPSSVARLSHALRLPPAAVHTGPPAASIVIPTAGAPTLGSCLDAVAAFTALPHECIVVADGVSVPAPRVRLPSPRGFAGACNAGARQATARRLVFLNDDTIVTPGWLTRLLAALDDGAGLAGPSTNASGDVATERAPYRDLAGLLSFAASRDGRSSRDVGKLSLFCLAIDRARFEALGGLDEGYGRGGFEDDELCMAVRRRGRAVRLVTSAWVHHHGSVSFERMSVTERIQRFETNRHRFEQRWGVRWRAPV